MRQEINQLSGDGGVIWVSKHESCPDQRKGHPESGVIL
jgi:hypothetical protein